VDSCNPNSVITACLIDDARYMLPPRHAAPLSNDYAVAYNGSGVFYHYHHTISYSGLASHQFALSYVRHQLTRPEMIARIPTPLPNVVQETSVD